LTDAVQPDLPSLWQHESYIHHNTLFNNNRTACLIDHDDGSCFYEDSYNFQIYGTKKNFLGHSKTDHHEIYVYTSKCLTVHAAKRGFSGWNETWVQNTCILYNSTVPYDINPCDTDDLLVPYLANNTIYFQSGTEVAFTCNVSGISTRLTLQQWQSYGLDIGTIVEPAPGIETIIGWGRKMLQGTM
jgi:hypothetical protein